MVCSSFHTEFADSYIFMLLLSISPHQVVSELGIWLKLALNACCQDSYTLHKSGILTMLFFHGCQIFCMYLCLI